MDWLIKVVAILQKSFVSQVVIRTIVAFPTLALVVLEFTYFGCVSVPEFINLLVYNTVCLLSTAS